MKPTHDPRVFAHLAYSTFFEKVVPTAVSTSAKYGECLAVIGNSGSVTIALPSSAPFVNVSNGIKDAFHILVLNCSGEFTVNVTADKNINGVSGLTIGAGDASAGALFLWSNQLDAWVAWLGCCAPPS